jgi:hypothetical protein
LEDKKLNFDEKIQNLEIQNYEFENKRKQFEKEQENWNKNFLTKFDDFDNFRPNY